MTNTDELIARRERLLGPGNPLFYDEPVHLVRGEGVWLFDDEPERAIRQLEQLRQLPFRGEVLFSYDSIAESPVLRDALLAHFGESTGEP